jgi:CubicO group peptidase (beta-lactamase class C family)/D-alanyl-D-alanine dipeptidase
MRRHVPSLLSLVVGAFSLAGCGAPSNATTPLSVAVRPEPAVVAGEVERQQIPALAIAVVDDTHVVWSAHFQLDASGHAVAASSDGEPMDDLGRVWRVGSVSKMFTDLAVMRLVEQGKLELDAPVTKWLPDFAPKNPFGAPITLRQLMAHRSGLVREPPVGHYFDATSPSIAATVASLNDTTLVYEPGTRTKYSNAGITVVGRVLEVVTGRPFTQCVREDVLEPMGLRQSAFERTPRLAPRVQPARMWRYDDEPFDAPTFELGIAPAGSLYTTLRDLAHATQLFLGGATSGGGLVVSRASLDEMWRPQFEKSGATSGFGLGFHVDQLDGVRRVGHDGAIYGFSTTLQLLPEQHLGVVAIAAMDCVHGVVDKLAEFALRVQLHERGLGPDVPTPPLTQPFDPRFASRLTGRWVEVDDPAAATAPPHASRSFELLDRRGELWLAHNAVRARVRRVGGTNFVLDDRLEVGTPLRFVRVGDPREESDPMRAVALEFGGVRYSRAPTPRPPPPPAPLVGLVGEYGWDHDVLFVYEKEGQLRALIEWFFDYPLTRESDDVYSFPSSGLYQDEKLVFTRDERGEATRATLGGSVVFPRRVVGTPEGVTFQIAPTKPIDELRRDALAAKPPVEEGKRAPELVDLATLDSTLRFDVRYATTNNFMGTRFYDSARAFLQRPAAEALVRAQKLLAKEGFGLLVHDAYRPWFVTKMFWDGTPIEHHEMVADPSKGSRHNRGCAVDLTLCDLATGKPVRTTSGYDEFSDRANPWYPGGTSEQRWLRDRLRRAMESQGFTVYEHEWWHFDYGSWRDYPVLNLPFEEIAKP